ncbi:MAG TPA: hypothetical protein VG291_18385 [Xanthobacteraceae bacterium]|jgi:hypothetical protein|nr:hypothetical protein [Xanthobacteraceae bacterium]
MRFFLQVPIVVMLSYLPAMAQEESAAKAQETLEIGQGVVCDTLRQVERYVALRGDGAEANAALATVNDEAHVPACSVVLVMFSAGERVGGLTAQGRLLSIIQIKVHAFSNGPAWMKIPETIRYTVTAEKGRIA